MNTVLTLHLSVLPEYAGISVEAGLKCSTPLAQDFSFCLSQSFAMGDAKSAGGPLPLQIQPGPKVSFLPPLQRVTLVGSAGCQAVSFTYQGPLAGWCYLLSPALCSLNLQSAWLPLETSAPPDAYQVFIPAKAHSLLVGGLRQGAHWFRSTSPASPMLLDMIPPANLLLVDESLCPSVACQNITGYCVDSQELPLLQMLCESYDEILAFYQTQLYPPQPAAMQYLVSLSLVEYSGGYFTPRGIVTSRFGPQPQQMVHWMAHEMAHAWCTGAPATWEDWLNETTAEWSSLLYDLHRGNTAAFEETLARKAGQLQPDTIIATEDASVPPDHHTRGTLLFYRLYQKYGQEMLVQLLRTYGRLPSPKTTENYLAAIACFAPQVARDIAQNLKRSEFIL